MKEIKTITEQGEYTIIEYTDGTKEKRLTACIENPEPVEPEPEPTQLDRIEAEVKKSQQDIIDEYTLELVEGGII